jgi:hypothetical protein
MRALTGLALALSLAGAPLAAQQAATGSGAVLRALDRLQGRTTDLEILSGLAETFGRLTITVGECRYPQANPDADAWAYVTILDSRTPEAPVFRGWMVASSPALNALDHQRYDVWVLRCLRS